MERYHPGTCEATTRGKRYGNNLAPQRYDNPGHVWSRAKNTNWGPWTCCGREVNSSGCQEREISLSAPTRAIARRGVGAYIQFLINNRHRVVAEDRKCWILSFGRVAKKATEGSSWVWAQGIHNEGSLNREHEAHAGALIAPTTRRGIGAYIQFLMNDCDQVLVVAENEKCWILSSRRVAKKATEGSSWVWLQDNNSSNDESLNHLLSRLSILEPTRPFYSFGEWGYHTNEHDSQIMPGFSSTPPGAEICGTYEVIFVAALKFDTSRQRANVYIRRQPKAGSLIIEESIQNFTIYVDGQLGTTRGASRTVTDQVTFDGEVSLSNEGHEIDMYFGPGYKFYGFAANSEATSSYPSMASNASLIVTKRNDNKGRIYRVDSPKAFKLVQNETGVVADESSSFGSQEHEVNLARRICKSRHYSFLCRELGLPCSASALITAFVTEHPPFIFAEPGDIWIDVRLSTPNRTYVLARPKSGVAFSEEKLELYAGRMGQRFLQSLDEVELLASTDVLLGTPNAGNTIAYVNLQCASMRSNATERSSIVDMIVILHNKGKVSKSDIEAVMTELASSVFYNVSNYIGEMFSAFWNIGVLDGKWLCDRVSGWGDLISKAEAIEGAMRAIQMSFGRESVRSCFGGSSERTALKRLLGPDKFHEIVEEFL